LRYGFFIWFKRWLLSFGVLLISGCYTSGIGYDESATRYLKPNVSTYDDALLVMGGAPVNVYPRPDGSKWALWYFSRALLPDAIYSERSTMLEFDSEDRFVRQVPYAK